MARDYLREQQSLLLADLTGPFPRDLQWHERIAQKALDTPLQAADRRVLAFGFGGMPYYDMVVPLRPEDADSDLRGCLGPMIRQPAGYRILDHNFEPLYEFSCGDAVSLTVCGKLQPERNEDEPETLHNLSRAALQHFVKKTIPNFELKIAQIANEVVFDVRPFEDPECGQNLFLHYAIPFCLPRQTRIRLATPEEYQSATWELL